MIARELAPLIASALGAEWSASPQDDRDYATIAHASGAVLALRTGNARGRVEVFGRAPRDADGHTARLDDKRACEGITCDVARGASAIARDIQRRMLPAYLPAYARAVEASLEAARAKVRAVDLARELATLAGPSATLDTRRDRGVVHVDAGAIIVTPQDDADPYVEITLRSVTPALARAIAALLAAAPT